MYTRIKICGITRPGDALAAAELGADAIGLVFYEPSRRAVSVERAEEIVRVLPPFVSVVALFLDADAAVVHRVLSRVPVDLLQFHGTETPGFCAGFGRRYIKTVPMAMEGDAADYALAFPAAGAFLLDSHTLGEAGGSGRTFDWGRIPRNLPRPVILAGGLHPDNVGEAVTAVSPHAVDVSSGVESAPGIKDRELMRAFIEAVRGTRTG